jgi:hypothetical protein
MIGVLGFDSRRGLGIFLFTTASRTVLGLTQPLIQWVPGALSLGVKRPGCETDHSPPSSAEVKNAWSYTCTRPIRLYGMVLSKAQGQLYLLLYGLFVVILMKLCFFLENVKKIRVLRLQSSFQNKRKEHLTVSCHANQLHINA